MTQDDIAATLDVIAAFPLPTLIIGQAQRIEGLNDAARALVGDAGVARHFTTVLRQPRLVEAVEQCLTDGTARSVAYQVLEHGRDAHYDVHLHRVARSDLLLVSFRNTTDLAEADQMRRDFVANVSHELRTPLTALMGFIETLRGPARDDGAARARFLDIMADEAGRMNRLIAGLLSLGRVEADERLRLTTRLDVLQVLQTAVTNLTPLAQDSGVTIALDAGQIEGQGALCVMGDVDQMLQVFTNLLENAIKYGGADQTVGIQIQRCARDPVLRCRALDIAITDHGPGIAPIHLPRLTERFYRVDSHRNRKLGGSGLGLAIVKHILNRHKGRLKIASQPGQGSRFSVILPLADPAP